MNNHRKQQWADITTKSLLIWLGIFVLLTVLGAETDWAFQDLFHFSYSLQ